MSGAVISVPESWLGRVAQSFSFLHLSSYAYAAHRVWKRCLRWVVSRVLRCGAIPNHVAIIMDGNRRWAEQHHLERREGHSFGFLQLKECLKWCLDLGVNVVTVYAFSIENFKRTQEEVDTLMALAADKLSEMVDERGFLLENGIRVKVLGQLERLPPTVLHAAAHSMAVTAHCSKATLNICMPYTSRQEMHFVAQALAKGVKEGRLNPSDITEDLVSDCLYTAPSSQVDLLIRTSGETRLSDFMLWQAGLSSLAFTSVLWPEFSLLDLAWCILEYQRGYRDLKQARDTHRRQMRMTEDSGRDREPDRVHWMTVRDEAVQTASGSRHQTSSSSSSSSSSSAAAAATSTTASTSSGVQPASANAMRDAETRRKAFVEELQARQASLLASVLASPPTDATVRPPPNVPSTSVLLLD